MIVLSLWQAFASAFVGAVLGAVGMHQYLTRRSWRRAAEGGAGVFGEPIDLDPARERAVRVVDAAWEERVRPAGWPDYHATLDVEPLDGGYVRVLWRMDPGDTAPEPATTFRRDEFVAVAVL